MTKKKSLGFLQMITLRLRDEKEKQLNAIIENNTQGYSRHRISTITLTH